MIINPPTKDMARVSDIPIALKWRLSLGLSSVMMIVEFPSSVAKGLAYLIISSRRNLMSSKAAW